LPALDLDGDPEPFERLVDFLVDVRLLLVGVLRAIPRLVEIPSRRARMERRVHRIFPIRRIAVLLRVLRIALGRAEPTVSLSSRLDGTDPRIPGGTRQVKGSTAGGVARSPGPAATAPSASTSPASSPPTSPPRAASRRPHDRR